MQEEKSNRHVSANAAIQWTRKEAPISNERLRRIYEKIGEKVNNKLEILQLSRKDQVSVSRMRSGHHPKLKYWLHTILSLGKAAYNSRLLNMQWGSVLGYTTL